ncbi:transposase [Klebsiella pneumoniae]|uniref:Mutator family transposase n=1 Tax=Klebsiella pneumoniae TaxID=573 RepID=A0A927E1X7_KLEPN|nr:transposase [Klebsiella pneumoniae]
MKAQPVGQIQYLVLDATYESVRVGSHVVKQALLVAIGVDYSGNRHILDAEVANSEAEVNWRSFLEGLVRRGMHGLRMITSDDHSGLRAAIDAVFPRNSVATLPVSSAAECPLLRHEKDEIPLIAADIRKVFNRNMSR